MLLCLTQVARAEEPPARATFALIVGVNQSVDPELPALNYADDDAAQYLDLFRALGARTYLLSRLDDNTKRLHPQAAAEAQLPRRQAFEAELARLAADVAQAHARHLATSLYFVYAGHGNVRDGEGYLSLEDERLTAADLERLLLQRVAADQVHFIIDACYSSYLAFGRGPGGQRRPARGFSALAGLGRYKQLGLLLSTSSARESHEWEGFQSGVFSHEVRSGLYGAADADHDGQVSYREIAAFVERANAAIPNERFRPDIYARPPATTTQLLDLRPGLGRRIEIDGSKHGHYLLEDSGGVRIAELNSGQAVSLIRPVGTGVLYLRRSDDQEEFVIPPSDAPVELASLEPTTPRARARGAAHDAFSVIFALPFDAEVESHYVFHALPDPYVETLADRRLRLRHRLGWGAIGLGGASLISGIALTLSANSLRDANASQQDIAANNHQIEIRNIAAGVLYGVAGATALTGVLLLVLQHRHVPVSAFVGPNGGTLGYAGSF
jgi:hypothetical protein